MDAASLSKSMQWITCDRHALTHATGQLVRIGVGKALQVGSRKVVTNHLLDLGTRLAYGGRQRLMEQVRS